MGAEGPPARAASVPPAGTRRRAAERLELLVYINYLNFVSAWNCSLACIIRDFTVNKVQNKLNVGLSLDFRVNYETMFSKPKIECTNKHQAAVVTVTHHSFDATKIACTKKINLSLQHPDRDTNTFPICQFGRWEVGFSSSNCQEDERGPPLIQIEIV